MAVHTCSHLPWTQSPAAPLTSSLHSVPSSARYSLWLVISELSVHLGSQSSKSTRNKKQETAATTFAFSSVWFFYSNHPWCIQVRLPNSSDDLCLLLCLILLWKPHSRYSSTEYMLDVVKNIDIDDSKFTVRICVVKAKCLYTNKKGHITSFKS